jgi:hypothetical protein
MGVGGGGGEGDVTRLEGVDKVTESGEHPPPSAGWVENTIMTECLQESGRFQSLYSLVCGIRSIVICTL